MIIEVGKLLWKAEAEQLTEEEEEERGGALLKGSQVGTVRPPGRAQRRLYCQGPEFWHLTGP